MNDAPKVTQLVPCPLCEGRGQLPKSELHERLREKDLAKKIESYLACVVEADQQAEMKQTPLDDHIQSWNLTHFLWRRSPKE